MRDRFTAVIFIKGKGMCKFIYLVIVLSFFLLEVTNGMEQKFHWDFVNSSEDWVPTNGLSQFVVENGILSTTVTGFDPYMHSPFLNVDASSYYMLEIKMAVDKGSGISVYWTTDVSPQWGEDKRINFEVIPDGKFHIYYIDLGTHRNWIGKIRQIRLDLEPPDTQGAHLKIDYIQLARSSPRIEISSISLNKGIPIASKPFGIRIKVKNLTGEVFKNIKISIAPLGEAMTKFIDEIPPRAERDVSFDLLLNKEGIYKIPVKVTSNSNILFNEGFEVLLDRPDMMTPKSNDIMIENKNILVRFIRSNLGFTSALIYGKEDKESVLLAVIHPLSQIVYLEDGERITRILCPNLVDVSSSKVIFRGSDILYDFWFSFEISSKDTVESSYSLMTKKEMKILRFNGPWLRVGEMASGSSKRGAIFPGLEWLVEDERSSSTLDVVEPYNLRLAPASYKVTTPCMGIELDRYLIGLLWENKDKNLSSIFCSPNLYEGQENHLLGLFLPSIPEYVKENETLAYNPYRVRRGEKLEIKSKILIVSGGTLIDLVPKWLESYGTLDVRFPRSFIEEIALCREGYKIIWDPAVPGFSHATPGQWAPEPYAKDAFLLLLDSILTSNEQASKMANEVISYLVRDPRRLSNPAGSHIFEFQLPFIIGYLPEGLGGFRDFIVEYIYSQKSDGSWGYSYGMSVEGRKLGKEGETNIGLCATPTSMILRYARVTGDKEAIESGLKALEFMKRFTVPRGAQIWEIPVHTPDILASARAIDAYIEGYILTGNKEYLDYAIYWAKTGLPFVYFWGKDDRPVMKYSTIPVFGATFYNYPWFGYPVQWNGLVYAYELLRLARYDCSFSWKDIAMGILASGMYQQMVNGRYKGLYPDSWDLINNIPRGPYINPEDLLKPLYLIMGIRTDLDTKIVKFEEDRVYITTISEIYNIQITNKELKFTVGSTPVRVKYVLISGLKSPPKLVMIGGENVRRSENIERLEKGWEYDKVLRSLVIKVNSSLDTGISLVF